MGLAVIEHRYHGLGFTLDASPDYEIKVWLPCEYDNGFQTDDSSYRLTVRDQYAVCWNTTWVGDDEDDDAGWTDGGFRRFDTVSEVLGLLQSLGLPLGDLLDRLEDARKLHNIER